MTLTKYVVFAASLAALCLLVAARPAAAKDYFDKSETLAAETTKTESFEVTIDPPRIQLKLAAQNATLKGVSEAEIYAALAQLEGPAPVIEQLRSLFDGESDRLNSAIAADMMHFDPQYVLHATFDRFRNHQSCSGDCFLLLKYGDKKTYQELGRRAEAGNFDPGSWVLGQQAERAAEYGKNWAIPFVAAMLSRTQMTGSRSFGGPAQNFCPADDAVVCFQQLSGKDFGYKRDGSEADRLAAIARARDWWNTDGKNALADKIAEDHPSATDGTDLLWSEDDLAATAKVVAGNDAAAARTAIASLPTVTNYQVQQSLATRLQHEADADQRLLILRKFARIGYWLAPTIAATFENDPSPDVRAAAATLLLQQQTTPDYRYWNRRLETRDKALTIIRRIADNPAAPPELRLQAAHILIGVYSFQDIPRLKRLAAIEPLSADPALRKWLKDQTATEKSSAPATRD